MHILGRFANLPLPKKAVTEFFLFGKVVGLQHQNLLKWNPMIIVFLGVTETIF